MQKSRKMNIINMTALPSAGKEARRELINFFMLGNLFMDLNGLRTLNVRKTFRFEPEIPGM
jgi:hypothetical protein